MMKRVLITHTPLDDEWWATSLKGTEALSELFEFTLGLHSNDPNIDGQILIGETVAVELET